MLDSNHFDKLHALMVKMFRRSELLLALLLALSTSAHSEEDPADKQIAFAMAESLAFSGSVAPLDLGALGQWQVFGAASGTAFHQTYPTSGNDANTAGFTNAQIMIQKTTGFAQFFVQAGLYSLPSLGVAYQRSVDQTTSSFGYVPHAWVSLVPNDQWSLMIGKLPSMGGYEATLTYQNINIQRGLLWNQTSSVSRGVQLNHTDGPFSASLAVTDGSYSNVYNWLGASLSYQPDPSNTFTAGWTGSVSGNATDTPTTPLLHNNSQIYNLIYTYSGVQWTLAPYAQYTYVASNPAIGINGASDTFGVALVATYHITPLAPDRSPPRQHFSIPFRLEYITSGGNSHSNDANLLYGAGSSAWSATITPTYQDGPFFVRAEASYLQTINVTPGAAFGPNGTSTSQARVMLEAGILY